MVTAPRLEHLVGSKSVCRASVALLLTLPFACDRSNPFPSGPTVAEAKSANAFIDISDRFGDAGLIHGWGGLAVFDCDNDGDLDIFLANGTGSANRLFRNDGAAQFVDVAAQAGVALPDDNCSACGVADLNNDGRLDLLLARQPGPGSAKENVGTVLMLNESSAANGTSFRRIATTQSGLDTTSALCLGIGDLDNDGLIDILVGAHDITILVPDLGPIYPSQPNELWRCTGLVGDVPTYEKVTTAKIEGTPQQGRSPETQDQTFIPGTFAVYLSDVDGDGRLDVFDLHDVPGGIDYFHNDGNMVFTRRQVALLNRTGGWMGMTGGDYDGDGDIDYFATNVGSDFRIVTPPTSLFTSVVGPNSTRFHRLMMNDVGMLTDVAAKTPISPSTALPPQNSAQGQGLQAMEFAFGCAWIDADNRGKLDLYFAGDTVGDLGALSRILIPGVAIPVDAHGVGRFLRNNGDGGFSDRTAERGLFNIPADGRISFGQNDAGRAVAACDLNGDGFRDLVVTNSSVVGAQAARLRVFLNPAAAGNHWLTVRLRGTASNRFGIGARIRAVVGKRTYVSEVLTTTSCFVGVHPTAHFGLGSAERIDELTVLWPSGTTTIQQNVATDQVITIME